MNIAATQNSEPKFMILDHDVTCLTTRRTLAQTRKPSARAVGEIYAVFGPCDEVPAGMLHFNTAQEVIDYVNQDSSIKSILSGYQYPKQDEAYGKVLHDTFGKKVRVFLQSDNPSKGRTEHDLAVYQRWVPKPGKDTGGYTIPNNEPFFKARDVALNTYPKGTPGLAPVKVVQEVTRVLPKVLTLNLPKTVDLNVTDVQLFHAAINEGNYYGAHFQFDKGVDGLDWFLGDAFQRPHVEKKDDDEDYGFLDDPATQPPDHGFKGAVIGVNKPEEVAVVQEMIAILREHRIERIAVVADPSVQTDGLRESGVLVVAPEKAGQAIRAATGEKHACAVLE